MIFSVIIPTYMRPDAIIMVLESIAIQNLQPIEVLVVDGSLNDETRLALENIKYNGLKYFKVEEKDRGAAKQRNFAIERLNVLSEITFFLDDDVVLCEGYFQEIINTYLNNSEVIGVGGYTIENNSWIKVSKNEKKQFTYYYFDGWKIKENQRGLIRKFLGLSSKTSPGIMPAFSHGRNSFPKSGKSYVVDLLITCCCSYKTAVLKNQCFDSYFEGYSLYEDTALSLRISKIGKLLINTKAQLEHYHHQSGRPNKYVYGKMVVRNGWYVWRIKNPKPKLIDRFKWHAITILLTGIRATNIFTTNKRKEAFTETIGRTIGLLSLIFNKPK